MIERHGDGCSKAEGENETERRNQGGRPSIPLHKPNVDLETNEEQEECDTDVAGKSEKGEGLWWEDGLSETGNATHD